MSGVSLRRFAVVIGGSWDKFVKALMADAVKGFVDMGRNNTLLIGLKRNDNVKVLRF